MFWNCGKHPGMELNPNLYSTRRDFLNRMGTGFGSLALASMLADQAKGQAASGSLLAPKQPHYPATAKRVCHIYFSGAQSQVDTWDPKPEMAKAEGKSTSGGGGMGRGKILPSPFAFPKSGKSGLEISEIWTELSKCVDDMCIIRSNWTDVPAHEEATKMMTTGDFRLPKPSIGAWVTYGLGSDNQNLPAFVAMNPRGFPSAGNVNWQSAFMPGAFQGTYVDPTNTRIEQIIENIKSQFIGSSAEQRQQLDLLSKINEIHKQKRQSDGQLDARIQSFELAYRMQTDATEAFDMSKEPDHILKLYGADGMGEQAVQARQFIIARRLLERGVKFVQCWNGGWDMHAGIANAGRNRAAALDKPMAGFLIDLKQRGLLKDTIVAASTEFGRSATEDGPGGRTHNAKAFSSWLAGGGVKGGTSYGATDELGSAAVENKVHVHEFHSTILHALGFDSEKLTFRSGGRDFRLTDVSGAQPVKSIFA